MDGYGRPVEPRRDRPGGRDRRVRPALRAATDPRPARSARVDRPCAGPHGWRPSPG